MFSYQISCNLWYSSNNSTTAVVRGDTPEVYTLSPLKILWDFGVVCLNSPIKLADPFEPEPKPPDGQFSIGANGTTFRGKYSGL